MSLKIYNYSDMEMEKFNYMDIETEKGHIILRLLRDEAPNTVANFATLADDGFYNGLIFHRVIPNFMAQSGCPTGTGMSGPGWTIACESHKNVSQHKRGTLSMAHAGRNTGGSQFFICFVDCPHLDGLHTVFGQIEDKDSFDVLDKIVANDKIISMRSKQKL